MPGCRRSIRSSTFRPEGERISVSRYVRLRAVAPKPANDNRSPAAPRIWHWAVALGAAPTIGLALIVSLLI